MNIEQLLTDSEQELENRRTSRTTSVGNRPHYPMFVAVGGGADQQTWNSIQGILQSIWPTTASYISCYHYTAGSTGDISFTRADGAAIEPSELSNALDDIRRSKGVFSDMIPWHLYNIIDTTKFKTLDDLAACYKAISLFKRIISDTTRSMLVVLMDYATDKKTLCQQMLSFLAENADYDSTVIFTTRDRAGNMYAMHELYRLAANVLLFSNNDAISASDDEDYRARVEMLYNGGILTASYFIKTPPHDGIVRQNYSVMIKALERELSSTASFGLTDWLKGLGFQNGKSDVCEQFLSKNNISVSVDALEAFPMRSPVKINVRSASYRDFKANTYEDALDLFIANYLNQISKDLPVAECVEQLHDRVVSAFPAPAFQELTGAFVDELMAQLDSGKSSEQGSLQEYLNNRVADYIRQKLIYPQFRDMLLEMGGSAKKIKAEVQRFCDLLDQYTSQTDFTDLGSVYETSTNNYLTSNEGRTALRMAIAASNDSEAIGNELYKCFCNAVASDESLYALSFTDEWARRLDLAGTAVYQEIGAELAADQSTRLLLPATVSTTTKKKIYALHTVDSHGENPTELYQYLKEAFRSDPLVQFFNTGRDECLEAFVFVECNRERLIRYD